VNAEMSMGRNNPLAVLISAAAASWKGIQSTQVVPRSRLASS
jgi:hypothetical protein